MHESVGQSLAPEVMWRLLFDGCYTSVAMSPALKGQAYKYTPKTAVTIASEGDLILLQFPFIKNIKSIVTLILIFKYL